jgi:hypothetical protein
MLGKEPATLPVPDAYRRAFQLIERLPETSWASLAEELDAVGPAVNFDQLWQVVARYLEDDAEAQRALDAVLSLADYVLYEGWLAKDAAREVAEALEHAPDSTLAERLERVLALPAVCSHAAARRSLTGVNNRVSDVLVATLVRSVFNKAGLGDQVLLLHDIRIGYQRDGLIRSVNVTLDPPAIRDLRDALQQAISDELELRHRLEDVFVIIDPEGEPGE